MKEAFKLKAFGLYQDEKERLTRRYFFALYRLCGRVSRVHYLTCHRPQI